MKRNPNPKADQWHHVGPRVIHSGPVRNAARASLTEGAFMELREKYPRMDRATLREIARETAKKHFRKVKVLPEPLN